MLEDLNNSSGALFIIFFQWIVLFVSVFIVIQGSRKSNKRTIEVAKHIATLLLFSTGIVFYLYFNNFILQLYGLTFVVGKIVETDFIVSNLENKMIFPNYELIFCCADFVFLFSIYFFEKKHENT